MCVSCVQNGVAIADSIGLEPQTTKALSIVTAAVMLFSLAVPMATPATKVKAGAVCTKANVKIVKSGNTFVCKKSGKKLVWRIQTTKQRPTQTPSTDPVVTTPVVITPGSSQFSIYTGGPGNATAPKSFELPVAVVPAPASANLKLWIYDPANQNRAIGSPGIWLRPAGSDWRFSPTSNSDGSYFTTLPAGEYIFDTVEPSGNRQDYGRKTYTLTISTAGVASINGLLPNSAGYFTVTLIDRKVSSAVFNPTSSCQLRELNVNPGMNVGFPKHQDRLVSSGVVRALIIPVEFPSITGKGEPAVIFRKMAIEMSEYFKQMSNNRVSFDFKILPSWHKVNFEPSKYKLGTWGSGDPGGYYQAVLNSADSIVDYSLFDVVYVLSPKEIAWTDIAYGPAFPFNKTTNDGAVRNGTISGADAYQQNERLAWAWMAHETGHLFGMHDLYNIDPAVNTYGDWDLMSNSWGDVLELNAWNRYTQNWLTDAQVRCLEPNQLNTPVEVLLNPLNQRNSEVKAAAIRLSDSEILVAEVRRNGGYDRMSAAQAGVLIYKVDMRIQSIRGGWQTQRRPGSTDPRFLDALLKPGDKIKVGDIQIEVVSSGAGGDLIRISK
jgi:M6 family metalloprotease-like protein